PPNAGKSTLINKLSDREIAIVTPQPGTTRDMIEIHLDLQSLPITLIHTAGLRRTEDEIEKIGIDRMLERARNADLILWLSPEGASPPDEIKQPVLCVTSKSDLLVFSRGGLEICALTGAGLEQLCKEIAARARAQLGDGGSALFSRQRHRIATQEALEAIQSALVLSKPLELIADDLRLALRKLGKIIGVVDVEEILDVIVSRFCIGK
ncbi:MAG: GTPase, partial [Methylocystis sp.]